MPQFEGTNLQVFFAKAYIMLLVFSNFNLQLLEGTYWFAKFAI